MDSFDNRILTLQDIAEKNIQTKLEVLGIKIGGLTEMFWMFKLSYKNSLKQLL